MSITCEKCGGKTKARGYGDCETFVRKRICEECGYTFFTIEETADQDKAKKLWYRYLNGYAKKRKEKEKCQN